MSHFPWCAVPHSSWCLTNIVSSTKRSRRLSRTLCHPAWAFHHDVCLSCKRLTLLSLWFIISFKLFPTYLKLTVFPLAWIWADYYSCPSVIAYTSCWILVSFKARQFLKLVKCLLNVNFVAPLNRCYLQQPKCSISSTILVHDNDQRLDFEGTMPCIFAENHRQLLQVRTLHSSYINPSMFFYLLYGKAICNCQKLPLSWNLSIGLNLPLL